MAEDSSSLSVWMLIPARRFVAVNAIRSLKNVDIVDLLMEKLNILAIFTQRGANYRSFSELA